MAFDLLADGGQAPEPTDATQAHQRDPRLVTAPGLPSLRANDSGRQSRDNAIRWDSPPKAAIGDAELEASIVAILHEQCRPPAATGSSAITALIDTLHDLLMGRAVRHQPPAVLYKSAADTRTGAWPLRTSRDDSTTRSWT